MTTLANGWRAVALLALALGTPLAAQATQEPPADEGRELSADTQSVLPADMTPDQLIVFFTIFSESEEMEAALGPAIEELMAPGERIANWQSRGVDILAELEALEGGAAAHLLRDTDDEIIGITDLTGAARPDLSGFESYALRPDPVGLVAERTFTSFFPGIWFEAATQRVRRGKALCYGGYSGVTLHTARPYTEWTEEELITTASVFAMVDRLGSREFCSIYSKKGKGRYAYKAVLPDGRELALMNSQETVEVVIKREELDAILRTTPTAQPPE